MAGNLVRVENIAQLFGVSVRRVQQITQEGIIQTVLDENGARRYDLIPTIQQYVKYLTDKAYGRDKSSKEEELKEQKLRAEIELKESQGELHRLRTDIALGKYRGVDEIQLDYQKFFVVFKKFAMAIPNRISGIIAGYVDPVTVRSLETDLTKEIMEMLRTFVIAGQGEIPGEKTQIQHKKILRAGVHKDGDGGSSTA